MVEKERNGRERKKWERKKEKGAKERKDRDETEKKIQQCKVSAKQNLFKKNSKYVTSIPCLCYKTFTAESIKLACLSMSATDTLVQ